MWELDYKTSWTLKNGCFWIVLLEKTLESPLDCKEIQPVHPEGNQFWIFIGRTEAEAETPILWPPDVKSWSLGQDWCWESLKVGEEGDDRGWDGWMASPTQWTWVWVSSRSGWMTGKPGMLHSVGLQRVRHGWLTKLNWTELNALLRDNGSKGTYMQGPHRSKLGSHGMVGLNQDPDKAARARWDVAQDTADMTTMKSNGDSQRCYEESNKGGILRASRRWLHPNNRPWDTMAMEGIMNGQQAKGGAEGQKYQQENKSIEDEAKCSYRRYRTRLPDWRYTVLIE